jgi:hypothetical protein
VGAGDLRPYVLVQFGSLLAVVLLTLLRPPAPEAVRADTSWLAGALGCYALAKLLEALDHQVFALGGVVSGHTLKHLVAAAGVGCLRRGWRRARGRAWRAEGAGAMTLRDVFGLLFAAWGPPRSC